MTDKPLDWPAAMDEIERRRHNQKFADAITHGPTEDSIRRMNRRQRIEAMPRVQFVHGRDHFRGPDAWRVGIYWGKCLDAEDGEIIYRRWIALRWRRRGRRYFRFEFDRR